MSNVTRDILFKDLFKGVSMDSLKTPNEIKVPNEFYQNLLDYSMERSYLNRVSERRKFVAFPPRHKGITWLQITRLPVHPDNMEDYDLLSRWQGVLSSMHAWGHRLLFLLQRHEGETNIYLGTTSLSKSVRAADAIEQIRESATGNMPGIELCPLSSEDAYEKINGGFSSYGAIGAVTGIPSFRSNQNKGMLQTLDQLSFGIRDMAGYEKDYALLVIADPLEDGQIADTISRMRKLGSEIHLDVNRSVSETENQGESKRKGAGLGVVSSLLGSCTGFPIIGGIVSGLGTAAGLNKQVTMNFSRTVSTQYLDKFAQYAEELTEQHIERLKKGRNLGFWNAGVYVLGSTRKDVTTVTGMLRSVYSGDQTYLEPIRLHLLDEHSGALDIVKYGFDLIPLLDSDAQEEQEIDAQSEWHIFGRQYQYLSTPMNTEELSLTTSLPRRDVPGLRFVKTAVRFANNPAVLAGDSIVLGKVVDTGVVQTNDYRIDPNALVRHALVTGSTGSGKSTTCKGMINEILKRDIPVLIIEPAKDDYLRWAIKLNKKLPPEKRFGLYMPGASEFDGVQLEQLALNPFQPGAVPGAKVDMMARGETLTALLNASLPVSDILPVIIDETVYTYLYMSYKKDFLAESMEQPHQYPKLDGLIYVAKQVLKARNYEQKVQENIGASLTTRFSYLTRGSRGKLLNVPVSTPFKKLFNRPAVVNLSRITGQKDKALIMSILMQDLYEYRMSAYNADASYREQAQQNKLMHLTLVEEAHNVLRKPQADFNGSGNPQEMVAELFGNMLSEIRSYGEGLMIVDQVPTRLIPDAIKNTNLKIVHRLTSPDDCEVMAAGLALRPDQRPLISALGVGNAIICGDMDDAAAWVRLKKPQ